jgi:hypothetical protein
MTGSWMSLQMRSRRQPRPGLAPAASASASNTTRRPGRGQLRSAWCQLWLPSPSARLTALTTGLGEREDDALVHGAAFQLAMGVGGLVHRHSFVSAQA